MMKGQSAIEYLATYGWMFLALAAVSSYAFSTISLGCSDDLEGLYTNSLEVNEFGFDIDNKFRLSVTSTVSHNITVTELNFNTDEESKFKSFNRLLAPGETQEFTVEGFEDSSSCQEMDMELIYDKGPLNGQKAAATVKTSHKIQ